MAIISTSKLPQPPSSDLMGHLTAFKSPNMHQQLEKWSKELGKFYSIRLAHKHAIVISDKKAIREILKKRPEKFRRLKKMASVFKQLKINGIFSAEGDVWKHQRKTINAAFNGKNLENFYPTIKQTTDKLVSKITVESQKKNGFNLKKTLTQYTVDLTVKLTFGYDIDTLSGKNNLLNKNLSVVFPGISRRIASALPWWFIYKTCKEKELENACQFIRDFLTERLTQTKKQLSADEYLFKNPRNIFQAMIAQQNNPLSFLTDDTILANAITLLLAGEDTTANSLAWLLHLISTHQDIQDQLFSEISALPVNAFEQYPLLETPLMLATVHESMRSVPVVPLLFIEPIEDTEIENLSIKKNTTLILLLNSLSHDEQLFKKSAAFNPLRWLGENPARTNDIFPFGSGPRLCPGRSLALLEMQLAACLLVKNFRLRNISAPSVKEKFDFVVMPDKLNIFFEPRGN